MVDILADSGTDHITEAERGEIDAVLNATELCISISGTWTRQSTRAPLDPVKKYLADLPEDLPVRFNTRKLGRWDSSLLVALLRIEEFAEEHRANLDARGLPDGVQRLLHLANAVPEKEKEGGSVEDTSVLHQVGSGVLTCWEGALATLEFLGDTTCSLWRFMRGRAQVRMRDIIGVIHDSGPSALPIITLISFLVGLILAFVGAIQLRMFGAQIYVADLVGIGMIREMGAIMTGVVMSGRTGAAFAAQLGTMQVNEEIDAFKTMGISPIDFLVLPRMIGLTLMMPFLCLYADLMGVLGGMVVGVTMLDLNVPIYWNETIDAVSLNDFLIGVFMSFVFGVLISLAGCLRGTQCGRSSASVGMATTSAVVTSIVWMVIATALITVSCDILGI